MAQGNPYGTNPGMPSNVPPMVNSPPAVPVVGPTNSVMMGMPSNVPPMVNSPPAVPVVGPTNSVMTGMPSNVPLMVYSPPAVPVVGPTNSAMTMQALTKQLETVSITQPKSKEQVIEDLLLLHGIGVDTVDAIYDMGITVEELKKEKLSYKDLNGHQNWLRLRLKGVESLLPPYCNPSVNEITLGVCTLLNMDSLQCFQPTEAQQVLHAYMCMKNMQQAKIVERKRKQNAPYSQQALA